MANTYGRGGVAQTSAAQRGDVGSAYEFSPKSAEAYLTGSEQEAYRHAIKVLGANPKMKKTGELETHKKTLMGQQEALEQAQRLREVAASRAFSAFEEGAINYSKPWLRKASEGLISAETVPHSLAGLEAFGGTGSPIGQERREARMQELAGERTFGALGTETGKDVRKKLYAASQGDYDVNFFGQPYYKYVASTPRGFPGGSLRQRQQQVNITNPAEAYAGIGGANVAYGPGKEGTVIKEQTPSFLRSWRISVGNLWR